jgi:hypothetical protein
MQPAASLRPYLPAIIVAVALLVGLGLSIGVVPALGIALIVGALIVGPAGFRRASTAAARRLRPIDDAAGSRTRAVAILFGLIGAAISLVIVASAAIDEDVRRWSAVDAVVHSESTRARLFVHRARKADRPLEVDAEWFRARIAAILRCPPGSIGAHISRPEDPGRANIVIIVESTSFWLARWIRASTRGGTDTLVLPGPGAALPVVAVLLLAMTAATIRRAIPARVRRGAAFAIARPAARSKST